VIGNLDSTWHAKQAISVTRFLHARLGMHVTAGARVCSTGVLCGAVLLLC
jgi:hypothetical protein